MIGAEHPLGPTYSLLQRRGEHILKGPTQKNAEQVDSPASRHGHLFVHTHSLRVSDGATSRKLSQ